ncbi:hypothetical protein ATPR_0215 [Acetobacter tropicalis NBRC 101654]|uniref:Uncharacterized protein n=1 Tax=Acetobacter tropicalis NBRC 101654 TaxID=749388 RepID=F7VA16_9PROT|nr:hypothetical protein ATPR_0215 [Acetobacter tropicalis NBRC 101654]
MKDDTHIYEKDDGTLRYLTAKAQAAFIRQNGFRSLSR